MTLSNTLETLLQPYTLNPKTFNLDTQNSLKNTLRTLLQPNYNPTKPPNWKPLTPRKQLKEHSQIPYEPYYNPTKPPKWKPKHVIKRRTP